MRHGLGAPPGVLERRRADDRVAEHGHARNAEIRAHGVEIARQHVERQIGGITRRMARATHVDVDELKVIGERRRREPLVERCAQDAGYDARHSTAAGCVEHFGTVNGHHHRVPPRHRSSTNRIDDCRSKYSLVISESLSAKGRPCPRARVGLRSASTDVQRGLRGC